MVIHVAAPVSISEPMQGNPCISATLIDKLVVARGSEVAKYMLKCTLMIGARVCCMLAKDCDTVSEVWASPEHGIHERTEGMLI